MTKGQIVKYVDHARFQALEIVKEDYKEKRHQIKQEYYDRYGISEVAMEVQRLASKAHDRLDSLVVEIESNGHSFANYYGVFPALAKCCDRKARVYDDIIDKFSINDKRLDKISDQYDDTVRKINNNYDNVIRNVKALSTAKKAIEYLSTLDFDINALTKNTVQEVNALTVPVDKSFLLIK